MRFRYVVANSVQTRMSLTDTCWVQRSDHSVAISSSF